MPIEKLIKRIKEEAEEKAEKIRQEAEQEKQAILEKAEKERVRIITFAKREASALKKRRIEAIIQKKEIEERMENIRLKRKIIDEVFKMAYVRFKNLQPHQYRQVMEKYFKTAVSSGNEEVIAGREEKYITPSFVQALNHKYGWKLKFATSKGEFPLGFQLKEGKKLVDFSLDSIFDAVKEELMPEIARILFEK